MMQKFLFPVFLFLLTVFPAAAYAFEGGACTPGEKTAGCAADCASCHSLTPKEADELLKTEKFRAKVTNVKMSQIKGLWEVTIEQGGKTFPLHMDFAKKHLVEGAKITVIADIGKMRKIDVNGIPLSDALIMGAKDAKNRIIVFSDPDCPYCQRLHNEIKKITEKRKDVAFLIKLYPLPIHPEAYNKAKAIICEKSLKLLDDAFSGKELPKPKCEAKEIDANIKLAGELGITGTPTMILPDGRVVPGYVEGDELLKILDTPQD